MRNHFLVRFVASNDAAPFDVFVGGWKRSRAISYAASILHQQYPEVGKLRMEFCRRTRPSPTRMELRLRSLGPR